MLPGPSFDRLVLHCTSRVQTSRAVVVSCESLPACKTSFLFQQCTHWKQACPGGIPAVNRVSPLVIGWEKPQHFDSSLRTSSDLSLGGSDIAPHARRTTMAAEPAEALVCANNGCISKKRPNKNCSRGEPLCADVSFIRRSTVQG
jgi:hypothetical protein